MKIPFSVEKFFCKVGVEAEGVARAAGSAVRGASEEAKFFTPPSRSTSDVFERGAGVAAKPVEAATGKAASEVVKELSELDKQGIEVLNAIDKPAEKSMYRGGKNFEQLWQEELPARLKDLNACIDHDLECSLKKDLTLIPSGDMKHTRFGFLHIDPNHPSIDTYIQYADARARLINYRITDIKKNPHWGGVHFNLEKI